MSVNEFENHDAHVAKVMRDGSAPWEPTLEVSYRNRVPLEVVSVRPKRAPHD
jgi:hypothetical protein